jgi:hypothetical protein
VRSLTLLIDEDGDEKSRKLADGAHVLIGVCWLDRDLRRQLDDAWCWVHAGTSEPLPAPRQSPPGVITISSPLAGASERR